MLPTFKSRTVHKIIEYLTLGLLSSLWNIYHSTTAYFDPRCILHSNSVKAMTSFTLLTDTRVHDGPLPPWAETAYWKLSVLREVRNYILLAIQINLQQSIANTQYSDTVQLIQTTYTVLHQLSDRSTAVHSFRPRRYEITHARTYIHCVSKKTRHQTLAHNFPKC